MHRNHAPRALLLAATGLLTIAMLAPAASAGVLPYEDEVDAAIVAGSNEVLDDVRDTGQFAGAVVSGAIGVAAQGVDLVPQATGFATGTTVDTAEFTRDLTDGAVAMSVGVTHLLLDELAGRSTDASTGAAVALDHARDLVERRSEAAVAVQRDVATPAPTVMAEVFADTPLPAMPGPVGFTIEYGVEFSEQIGTDVIGFVLTSPPAAEVVTNVEGYAQDLAAFPGQAAPTLDGYAGHAGATLVAGADEAVDDTVATTGLMAEAFVGA